MPSYNLSNLDQLVLPQNLDFDCCYIEYFPERNIQDLLLISGTLRRVEDRIANENTSWVSSQTLAPYAVNTSIITLIAAASLGAYFAVIPLSTLALSVLALSVGICVVTRNIAIEKLQSSDVFFGICWMLQDLIKPYFGRCPTEEEFRADCLDRIENRRTSTYIQIDGPSRVYSWIAPIELDLSNMPNDVDRNTMITDFGDQLRSRDPHERFNAIIWA